MRFKANVRDLDALLWHCKECLQDPNSELDMECVFTQFADTLLNVRETAVKLLKTLASKKAEVERRAAENKASEEKAAQAKLNNTTEVWSNDPEYFN